MLGAVENMHKCGFLHRDIKLEDFRIKDNQIYLIDFGQSEEYLVDEKHYEFETGVPMRADPLTSTIYAHQGHMLSRRDDLIALTYSMI